MNKSLEKKDSKTYFASKGTVVNWWREEKWSDVLKMHFREQESFLTSMNWQGKYVLDAGTGFGRFSRALLSEGAKVCAVDISMEMLGLARTYNKEFSRACISWCRSDVEKLPFENEVFDAVVCMETLMHVPNPSVAIKELARVVKVGGMVILGINNRCSLPYLVQNIQIYNAIYRKFTNAPKTHHADSIYKFKQWLEQADLKSCKEFGVGLLHPEINFNVLYKISFSLMPKILSKYMLLIEKKYSLGRKWPRYFMKSFMIVARKI